MPTQRLLDLNTGTDQAKYAELLGHAPGAMLYHSPDYLRLLSSFLDGRVEVAACLGSGGEILAALPFMVSSSPRGLSCGPVINSLPFFGSHGGVLAVPELDGEALSQTRSLLAQALLDFARQEGCASLTVTAGLFDADGDWYGPALGATHQDERIALVTPLPVGSANAEDVLLASFEDPRPRNIRKARKSGIVCRLEHGPEPLEALRLLHEENIGEIGGRTKPPAFFRNIPDFFPPEQYGVFTAQAGDELAASLLVFFHNDTAEYFVPAVRREHRNAQPLALAIFEAMLEAARRGCRHWNWGGTWKSQDGVYAFKKKWGVRKSAYRYHTRVFDPELLRRTPEKLLAAYPYFYVLPFSALASEA